MTIELDYRLSYEQNVIRRATIDELRKVFIGELVLRKVRHVLGLHCCRGSDGEFGVR